MPENAKSNLVRALRDALGQPEHRALAASDVVAALDELAMEIASGDLVHSEPFFQAVDTQAVAPVATDTGNRLNNFVYFEQRPEGARVAVEVMTLHGLTELEGQMEQRGLFLDIPAGPVPGQVVDVCLMMPNIGAEIWFEGRVVFQSPSGTAIDLRPPEYDIAAAWAQAQAAFRSATPFRRAPSGQPQTAPPRLQRRTHRARERVPHASHATQTRRAPATNPAVSPVPSKELSQRLHTRLMRLRRQHAFDRLGVHWSAYTTRILDAYRREVAPFLPENLPADAQGLDSELRQVIARLTEARNALRDQDCRRALRKELVSDMEIRRAVHVYAERGDLALVRGDLEGALDAFRRVVELAPDNNAARAKLTLLSTGH